MLPDLHLGYVPTDTEYHRRILFAKQAGEPPLVRELLSPLPAGVIVASGGANFPDGGDQPSTSPPSPNRIEGGSGVSA